MKDANSPRNIAVDLRLRNPFRAFRIRSVQKRLLEAVFDPNTEKLVIILTPGRDEINGGVLSIASIFRETRELKNVHQSEALLCTVPGEPLLMRYTKFKNDNDLFELSMVLRYFSNLKEAIIHVPEYCIKRLVENLTEEDWQRLRNIKSLHINIMLQKMTVLPDLKYLKSLGEIGKLTCTTAHAQYSSLETRQRLDIPLHKLSVWNSPELYERKQYAQKENLMIVSPDPNPHRAEVMDTISRDLPSLRVVTIRNMPYEEYRETVARAKWALTFGEGLDGYLLETIFSGGVSFAVYNSTFFTPDFGEFKTIYSTYNALKSSICSDITQLDEENEFTQYQSNQHNLCAKYYNRAQYLENLRLFYEGRYTFP